MKVKQCKPLTKTQIRTMITALKRCGDQVLEETGRDLIRVILETARLYERLHEELFNESYRLDEGYREQRRRLLIKRWEEEGLAECTVCESVKPATRLKLFLVIGTERRMSGPSFDDSTIVDEPFRRLERLCGKCKEQEKISGYKLYEVRFVPDRIPAYEYHESKGGKWRSLSEQIKLREPEVTDERAEKWNIPPALNIGRW